MRTSENYVQIDVAYLKDLAKKMDMSYVEFGRYIGQGDSFMSNAVNLGRARKATIDLICRLCDDCDYAKLTYQDKPPQPLLADDKAITAMVNTMIRIEAKLDRLLAELT